MKRILLVIALFVSSTLAHAQTGFLQKTIEVGGKPTRYVVYVPATYDAAKPTPTILFLHGSGETGADGWKQVAVGLGPAIMLNADRWNYLVIFPQKPPSEQRGWIAFEQLMLDVIAQTKKEYNVDASRLYCTGLSMGGAGTMALANKHPQLFAAIAPMCGGGDPAYAPNLKMPLWYFYGDQDGAAGIERCNAMLAAITAAGGNAKLTLYPGVGHNCWDKAYRDEKLHDWFVQFTLKK